MIKVKNKEEALALAKRLLFAECSKSEERSMAAGYDIYTPVEDCDCEKGWISDLEDRLEVNYPNGESENIWIAEKISLSQLLRYINQNTSIIISVNLFGLLFSVRRSAGYFANTKHHEFGKLKEKEITNISVTEDGNIEITLKM